MTATCAYCGKLTDEPAWRARRRRYCSTECRAKAAGEMKRGSAHPAWKGGRKVHHGWILVHRPGHARADKHGYVREHILIAERVTGITLPPAAVVHHVNEVRSDNRPANLVICQNQAYHVLLHARARLVRNGANPNTEDICRVCDRILPRRDFHASKRPWNGSSGLCRSCYSQHYAPRRAASTQKGAQQ